MTEGWPAQWLKGVLELCVLSVVGEGETYGYAIAQRLGRVGFGEIKGGTLYPILMRLETDGLIESRWGEGTKGPGRKFYRLTDTGAAELARRRDQWHSFTKVTEDLLYGEEPG